MSAEPRCVGCGEALRLNERGLRTCDSPRCPGSIGAGGLAPASAALSGIAPQPMGRVIAPPSPHTCTLPVADVVAIGTLAECPRCGLWWFSVLDDGPCRRWRRVRPYHWRLRRRIAQHGDTAPRRVFVTRE